MTLLGKLCPKPWVENELAWIQFLNDLTKEEVIEMLTSDEAITYLNSKGLIQDVDYWKSACKVVKNLDFVFIKWANSLVTIDVED